MSSIFADQYSESQCGGTGGWEGGGGRGGGVGGYPSLILATENTQTGLLLHISRFLNYTFQGFKQACQKGFAIFMTWQLARYNHVLIRRK
jgi:hypothetical protein